MTSSLRIAWAGPLKRGSAIGREGVRVSEALAARGHVVELIGADEGWSPEMDQIACDLPRRGVPDGLSTEELAEHLADYDGVVVNVGDHYPNHAGIFPLLDAAPCLAVVHDMYLFNLFNGWLAAQGDPPDLRGAVMVQTYGARGAELAERFAHGQLPQEAQAAECPMTEWIAARAAGCLAHAPFYAPRLLASCAGPVGVAGLPVAPRAVAPLPVRSGRRVSALTVGYMNRNKCADRVIEAIAASPRLKESLDYRLVGPIEHSERVRLLALAARLGYRRLSIRGPAEEEELDAALNEADLIVCLRRPVLEGASGSLVEALLSGRPTVVADAGCYAACPDDAVIKVAADVPVVEITAALERLVGDEPFRRDLGERGRAYAERAHTVESYVEVIEPLIRATARAAPILRAARGLGVLMAGLGLKRGDPAGARIARTLQPVFAPEGAASQGASSAAG